MRSLPPLQTKAATPAPKPTAKAAIKGETFAALLRDCRRPETEARAKPAEQTDPPVDPPVEAPEETPVEAPEETAEASEATEAAAETAAPILPTPLMLTPVVTPVLVPVEPGSAELGGELEAVTVAPLQATAETETPPAEDAPALPLSAADGWAPETDESTLELPPLEHAASDTTFEDRSPTPAAFAGAATLEPADAAGPATNAPLLEMEETPVTSAKAEAAPDKAGPQPETVEPQPEAAPEITPQPGRAAEATATSETRAPVALASIPHVITQLVSKGSEKAQQLRIRLDPPRLGEISVDLRSGENGLEVRIVAQTPEARNLLEQDLPRLRELLQASGFPLDSFSTSLSFGGQRSQAQPAAPASAPGLPSPALLSGVAARLERRIETASRLNTCV